MTTKYDGKVGRAAPLRNCGATPNVVSSALGPSYTDRKADRAVDEAFISPFGTNYVVLCADGPFAERTVIRFRSRRPYQKLGLASSSILERAFWLISRVLLSSDPLRSANYSKPSVPARHPRQLRKEITWPRRFIWWILHT